jgi:hypothetical protein
VVVRVKNRCGNPYLSKGITKESEVADTKGSTATGASEKNRNILCVFLCVPSHNKTEDQSETKGVWVKECGDGDVVIGM